MHLIYIDEAKYNPPKHKYYWLCGLAFSQSALREAELKVSEISNQYFGTPLITKETEFHAKDIVHGKGNFKSHKIEPRLELFKNLLQVIDTVDGICKIEICIDPEKIVTAREPANCAFMLFVEKADAMMKRLDSCGVLIADEDKDKVSYNVGTLSRYKSYQTDWTEGRSIECLLDTTHHTKSHHSRMIQLADIYTYVCALKDQTERKYFSQSIFDFAQDSTKVLLPDASKRWPTALSPMYQFFRA